MTTDNSIRRDAELPAMFHTSLGDGEERLAAVLSQEGR